MTNDCVCEAFTGQLEISGQPVEEVQEVIQLPQKRTDFVVNPNDIVLPEEVLKQVHEYVTMICELYRKNYFHNFEHPSHVTQSVSKLISCIVAGDGNSFGITSDPITQFACAFSALIHDVDHTGWPNAVLVKERAEVAKMYNNKSVAEHNLLDIAWALFMEDQFADLQAAIYFDEDKMKRFCQALVNSVMATDIADKDLGAKRKERWAKAFALASKDSAPSLSFLNETDEDLSRKATIVIEHLIQASDSSHTMQHWHVYLKWNERLFHEMRQAFLDSRLDANPANNWAKGEIGFFDFCIIPLAKKLKECGVFGVSSDEYLNYAEINREEWAKKGEQMVWKYMTKHADNGMKVAESTL